ncbi:MAG TPA: hypothetical protein PLV70_09785 [Flavobacteriales bacterium]|nr:hypothetical protein [Flavobacteriales bacterium]HRO40371.1 hypothetical protein [Flavobacteriales bacterium]HRP82424.1 hypothetical protein [Flavobacteriales bacterium]HRQ85389.1 hypothetical protein [Flavobacteriales bacterium]
MSNGNASIPFAVLRDRLLLLLMNGQVVVGADDQKIGRSDDGNTGMALAAEAAGQYGKKK